MLDLRLCQGRRGREDRDGIANRSLRRGLCCSEAASFVRSYHRILGLLLNRFYVAGCAHRAGYSVPPILADLGCWIAGGNRVGTRREGNGSGDVADRLRLSNSVLGVRNAAPDRFRHVAACAPHASVWSRRPVEMGRVNHVTSSRKLGVA